MTNEEAYNRIDAIIAKHEIDDVYVTITSFSDYDALRMARKALEQEPTYYPPCIDCNKKMDEIRRAYDKLKEQEPKYCDRNICIQNEYNGIGCDECEVTKSQEPKTGHWIDTDSDDAY